MKHHFQDQTTISQQNAIKPKITYAISRERCFMIQAKVVKQWTLIIHANRELSSTSKKQENNICIVSSMYFVMQAKLFVRLEPKVVVICNIGIDSSLGKQIVGKTNKRQVKINPNYHGVDLIVWNIVFPTLHLVWLDSLPMTIYWT